MSWVSPLTVPIHTLPLPVLSVLTRYGFNMSVAAFIHLAAMSISGINTLFCEKSLPTIVIPTTRPRERISCGSMPSLKAFSTRLTTRFFLPLRRFSAISDRTALSVDFFSSIAEVSSPLSTTAIFLLRTGFVLLNSRACRTELYSSIVLSITASTCL